MTISQFQRLVWEHYREYGRFDLPWRKTTDPYHILVSEVMLQQTQVDRVRPFYTDFMMRFPTVDALAAASLGEVLQAWQGLGYNRRAKMLHEAAGEVVEKYKGKFPKTVPQLQELRGVGPYTARAIAAFAYNQDDVFIETNLRTVVTYHFFSGQEQVSDKEVLAILEKALPRGEGKAREWYSALMDYGAYLKRSGVRVNAKNKTYTKQTAFEGSKRQARGAILKALVRGPRTADFLIDLLGSDRHSQMRAQLAALTKEGLIELKDKQFQLPD
jgi:A/G-specific adenine glycosylase